MSNSSGQRIPVNRFGLTEVFSPGGTKPLVDVVFVHGLNGDPHNTWTSENSKVFWPAVLLPPILEEEKARVLVYGYDADVTSFTDGVAKDKIHNHAEHLVAELAANRRIRKATERPILWVAHSLGGLVLKRALIHSSEIRGLKTEHLRSIFVSTYGISFLGTPHHGSDIAQWGNRLEWICSAVMPKKIVDSSDQLINALKTNNETLQNIDRQFIQIMSRFHIYFFHEGKPTNLKGTLRFIVDETSASPTVQDVERAVIQADHSHMCKFESENSPGFDLVAEGIQRYADEAPTIITARWGTEKEQSMGVRKAAADELDPDRVKSTPQSESASIFEGSSTGSSTRDLSLSNSKPDMKDTATDTVELRPSLPSEPYFIVPPGFRPNSLFVGMDKELQEIDRRLFDRRRRDGTASVLLYGQPGAGKSHLARQYVNKQRKKFKGGIFWIVSHLKEERDQAYEGIYQKAVSRESPESCSKIEGGKQSFVELVRAWFESRQEWLIVFDGISVETDAEVTDLARFVPDSQNSAIIYVSRQRNLESKQRLLRPIAIRVPPLNIDDARKLLFKELHIRKPTEAETKNATKLARQIDCLPLAIDAIAHRIADTREPLSRYTMRSFSANPKLEGTYNQILDDLQRLGHMEAWNLINILAFFGQHVPVEMLHLGSRGLKSIQVESSENGGKPDLNTTFGILIKYALLERNEPDTETSSSRDSLVEPEPIDMLRIHSVVQNFCLDSLDSRKMLPEWIQHAAQLLEHSYYVADSKIKEKEQPARVSDYRYYLTHCKRLHEHLKHFESKRQSLAPIRAVVEPLLEAIQNEIANMEPGTSQEIVNRIYQVSIFDRTSSSSDSVPSAPSVNETRTPSSRPSPLPLAHETIWGTDSRTPSLESPASIIAPRGPRIVGTSPYPGFHEDFGYESDREIPSLDKSRPMRKNPSETTEKPQAVADQNRGNDGWQTVQPSKRLKKPRDLGSFRPTPSRPIRAELSRYPAFGSVAQREQSPDNFISEAKRSLSKVHSRSPPASRNFSSVTSFWQRRPSQSPTKPTWANIAAGQVHNPRVQPIPPAPVQPIVPSASSPPGRGRQPNAYSSPLTAEFRPDREEGVSPENSALLPEKNSQFSSGPGYDLSPRSQPVPSYYTTPALRPMNPSSEPRYISHAQYPRTVSGPNPSPLPYEQINEAISMSSKRPRPVDFQPDGQAYQNQTSPRYLPLSSSLHEFPNQNNEPYYPMSSLPTGYYSQPMSRDGSRFSRISAAETEPLRFPSQFPAPNNAAFSVESSSPRDRFPDGRPLRKSPRSDYGFPSSNNVSPYDLSSSLHGAGGWVLQEQPESGAMSRSSSGPGIAIDGAAGHGLGIVPFDGHLRFGEHNPISIEEARKRAWEWGLSLARDSSLASRDRRREERHSAPYSNEQSQRAYPEINLMPTQSNPDAMRKMVGEAERR